MTQLQEILSQIQDKVDSPDRLAMLQAFGPEFYAVAEELNAMRHAILELYSIGLGDQNNVGKHIGPIYFNGVGEITVADVASQANLTNGFSGQLTIVSIETPVFIECVRNDGDFFRKYIFAFLAGKGIWGTSSNPVMATQFKLISLFPLSQFDIPASDTTALGEIADGSFINVINSVVRNFNDTSSPFYFSWTTEGKLSFAMYNGGPGLFGGNTGNLLEEDDFAFLTDSEAPPVVIPDAQQVLDVGNNVNNRYLQLSNIPAGQSVPTHTMQFSWAGLRYQKSFRVTKLVFDDPASPIGQESIIYIPSTSTQDRLAKESQVNGLQMTVNQSSGDLLLKNMSGATLATVNLGFLNNEATSFLFNSANGTLEMKNDAGELLTSFPVSSLVANLVHGAAFSAGAPSNLQFKDSQNNVLFTVPFTIANISGLQVALDGLVVPDAGTIMKGKLKLAGDFGGTADDPRLKKIQDLASTENKVVTVKPDSTLLGESIVLFDIIDETTSGFATLAAIASAYPTSSGNKKHLQVWCPYMATPTLYKKCGDGDDVWIRMDTQITRMT